MSKDITHQFDEEVKQEYDKDFSDFKLKDDLDGLSYAMSNRKEEEQEQEVGYLSQDEKYTVEQKKNQNEIIDHQEPKDQLNGQP